MTSHRLPIPLLVLTLLALPAAAQDTPIEQITASHAMATENAWTLGADELAAAYPAIARAIATPDHIVSVPKTEQASTKAFFDQMEERAADAVVVDGTAYAVSISIASGGMPPAAPDASSHSEVEEDASSRVITLLVGLAALSMAVALASMGLATLALRRR